MGILAKGKYTYGNKTWAQLTAITGASVGDTVFDTTYNKLRSWDGYNFVHGHQISQESIAVIEPGFVMVPASSANHKVDFQRGSADVECIVGIGEDKKTGTIGDFVPVTYHGDVKIFIDGAASLGNYVKNSTANVGYGDAVTTATTGVFGVMLGAAIASGTGLRRCLFKPVERS